MEFLFVLILTPIVVIGLWLLWAKIQGDIEENKRANDPVYQNYLKEKDEVTQKYEQYLSEHSNSDIKEFPSEWGDESFNIKLSLIFDNTNKKIVIRQELRHKEKCNYYEFNFSQLIGSEYSENNQVIRSANTGAATVGGILGGATGAIIGASMAKTDDKHTINITMHFDSFSNPVFNSYSSWSYNTKDEIKTKIKTDALELYGLCEYVINQNKTNNQQ